MRMIFTTEARGALKMRRFLPVVPILLIASLATHGQNPAPNTENLKKVNTRPAETKAPRADPFDASSIEKMSGQCVTLDTTAFSRVVKGFVIQGGNLSTSDNWNAELAARMARHLPDEPSDVKHVRGTVSMARGDEPNSEPLR